MSFRSSIEYRASRGSSNVGSVLPLERLDVDDDDDDVASEYHGRLAVSVSDTTSDRALVVGIPRWCIASLARNSRTLLLRTALPSAPRQNGVVPPPLSCNSCP